MRIIVIGGAGTIGKAVLATLSDRHELIVAGRRSGPCPWTTNRPTPCATCTAKVGTFDALVCRDLCTTRTYTLTEFSSR